FLPVGEELGFEIKVLVVRHENFPTAAIDCGTRLDDDKPVLARGVGVRNNLKATHGAPAVETLVVPTQFAKYVTLLVGEIAFNEQLAREVIIPGQLRDIALDAIATRSGVAVFAVAFAHDHARFLNSEWCCIR